MKLLRPSDLTLILPSAGIVAMALASIQPGSFWVGFIGFSGLLTVGFLGLKAAVRWAGGGRTLGIMTALALGLRLAAGSAVFLILPVDGYNEPDDRAGYIFTDAHRRDDQAWELASSKTPIWAAFDRGYYTDQYGGLLAVSALTYKALSPDAHRPLLMLTLAALVAAMGVPVFFRTAGRLWEARLATTASWIFCVYPESVITGGAQMREPFLLTFIAVALYGFAEWLTRGSRRSWLWMLIGLAGLLLVSPGVVLALLILLGVWGSMRSRDARAGIPIWIAAVVVFAAALVFFALSVRSTAGSGGTPLGMVARWFQDAVQWVIYELERGSGQVQNVFSKLFPAARFLFVMAYGVTQPLLPPAFLEPTTTTWHVIGVLRSAGWYLLLPLLAYAPFAIGRLPSGAERDVWRWLAGFSWLWIFLCSVRAGGDQWDNPRYRLIFFGIQALVAAWAWLRWRTDRDPWLPRILVSEALCLLFFGQWYVARYFLIGTHFPIMVVMGMCIAAVLVIMLGGALWDRLRRPHAGT